jgi:hypothetical protein
VTHARVPVPIGTVARRSRSGYLRVMKTPRRIPGFFFAALAAAVLAGCGDDPVQPLPQQAVAPDWHLEDVNPNSPTAGQHVTVRSQLGKVSAWYFAHAT